LSYGIEQNGICYPSLLPDFQRQPSRQSKTGGGADLKRASRAESSTFLGENDNMYVEVKVIKPLRGSGGPPVHEFRRVSTFFERHAGPPPPDKPGRPALRSDYEKVGMKPPAEFEPEEDP
jgi:hypothetical protein